MLRIFLFVSTFIFFFGNLSAQSCLPNGITFNSQTDIDNFAANYPGCTEILGPTTIINNNSPYITNLNGLSQITSIQGNLSISFNSLTSLVGLDNLVSVNGDLTIGGSAYLTDFSGLESLTSISGEIEIVNNSSLMSLNGIDNIDYSGITYLRIYDNPNLTFCSVTSICGYLANGGASSLSFNAFACDMPADIAYSCISSLPCPEPGILFRNQQQIDDFPLNYPTCTSVSNITIVSADGEPPVTNLNGLNQITSITGDLYIHNNDDLLTLTGLGNLTSIGGYLQIGAYAGLDGYPYAGGNNSLYSLEGLNSLISIGDKLEIHSNHDLADLNALSNLTSVGGNFKVTSNSDITNFAGFENLTSIGGSVWIDQNSSLTTLTGLEGLTTVGDDIRIGWGGGTGNNALTSIEGLSGLTTCGGMRIINNDVLPNLRGLENLTSINGFLWIYNNNALVDLSGLQNLTSVAGSVSVYRNDALSSIAGLSNIDYAGISSLAIYENPNLSECSISSVCDFLYNGGTISPYNNDSGCNSEAEILAGCSDPCANNVLYINGQPISDGVYQAPNQLNSNGAIINGSTVDFKAGQLIRLSNGFIVEPNADFSGKIEDCN